MKKHDARDIKRLIKEHPEKANDLLTAMFVQLGTRKLVAEHYGVSESTVAGWIERLEARGFRDPRTSARQFNPEARAPRARRHPLLLQAEAEPEATRARILAALNRQPGEAAYKARARAAKRLRCSEITIRRVAERLGIEA